jgi:hypothetical protein
MQGPATSTTAAARRSKSNERLLQQLRTRLESGDLGEVARLLLNVGADLFTRVREQKLLVLAPAATRAAFADILRGASRNLDAVEHVRFDNYLTFALEVQDKRDRCIEQLHGGFKEIPHCSLVDLIVASDEVLEWFLKKQFKTSFLNSKGLSVADYERRLHERNGASLDISLAIARLVNEYGRFGLAPSESRLTRAQRRKAAELMRSASVVAGEANSLEYFFDSVTYGEFVVERIDDLKGPVYRFHFADARRCLLKSLAIRRKLARRNAQQAHDRFLRGKLKELEEPILKQAVVDYLDRADSRKRVAIDLEKALGASKSLLLGVEAEDDLLLAASQMDRRTFAYFFVGMALRWYALAAEIVRNAPQVRARALAAAAILQDDLTSRIRGLDAEHMVEAFEHLTSGFPARTHVTLADRPFLKDRPGVVRPFCAGTMNWTLAVRKALLQGGATGKGFGAMWENFYAESFKDTDWKVVGRAIKLRNGGETLTDVDLLLLRGDLLLVMQVKGLIGANSTPYDHWKNRETVRIGCWQARVASDFLEANPAAVIAVCGKRLADSIEYIQPVVLTNIDELDGWHVDGVAVIGEVTRKAICRGARVDLTSNSGEVIHTHHFVKPEDLNTASILQLFDEPVEMRLAIEGTETTFSTHRIGGLTLEIPDFGVKLGEHDVPSYEAMPNDSTRTQVGSA